MSESTRVVVVGAGAIGSFYGAILKRAGCHVSVVLRSEYEAVKAEGFQIDSPLGDLSYRPDAVYRDGDTPEHEADYVICCVKVLPSIDRAALIKPWVGENTRIVLIENGIDIEREVADALPDNPVISCLAFIAVSRVAPGKIEHKAFGSLTMGAWPEGITDAWPHGANAGIRRELIGNSRFDPRFGPGGDYSAMGDETEFVSRLIEEKGAEIVYLPEACAHHTVREEELSRAAIWARAFKWGRTRGLVEEGDKQKLRLRGVPINIWLSAARAFLRFAPYCFGPEDGYLKYGWQWQVRSGRVAGYRELRRRRRGEPNDDGAR